jgi:uncharacterized protein
MLKYFRRPQQNELADNLTFIVTDDCNLRCRYCYQTDKQPRDMSVETALQTADYFFDIYQNKYDKVVFDFIGGEPFVRIDLLDNVIPYMIKRFERQKANGKWKSMLLGFSTNGTCFGDERVRDLIAKYGNYMSVGLSLDGVKAIHNYNRDNSFDEVMRWFAYWRQTFPRSSTKSTLNHEAIPYVFESIKFLTSTCLNEIYMNTIYEDCWQEGDDQIFYDQLKQAADYILTNKIYKQKYVSLFDTNMLVDANTDCNWCGTGSCMLAVDYQGDIFPCMRFKTLSKMEPLAIGNIKDGIDYKKLLPFYFCHNTKNKPDCENCEARQGCPNCTAFCYNETGSIFDRVSYMCKMHVARKKANEYYWNRMAEIEGVNLAELLITELDSILMG